MRIRKQTNNKIRNLNLVFEKGCFMRKVFMCSLCHGGIIGGGLYLEPETLTYRTSKLTVDAKYRNLVLPLKEIQNVTWKRILFPIATFHMKNGEEYKILIFNKSRFIRWYSDFSQAGE